MESKSLLNSERGSALLYTILLQYVQKRGDYCRLSRVMSINKGQGGYSMNKRGDRRKNVRLLDTGEN